MFILFFNQLTAQITRSDFSCWLQSDLHFTPTGWHITVFSWWYAHLQSVVHPALQAFSHFQILCYTMGNHIWSVGHPQFFLDLTLFSAAHITARIVVFTLPHLYAILNFECRYAFEADCPPQSGLKDILSYNFTCLKIPGITICIFMWPGGVNFKEYSMCIWF